MVIESKSHGDCPYLCLYLGFLQNENDKNCLLKFCFKNLHQHHSLQNYTNSNTMEQNRTKKRYKQGTGNLQGETGL